MSTLKPILVIGATGAQGSKIVKALLAPSSDGKPSPYSVRVLTRDASHPKAQALAALGNVELFQGSFSNFDAVAIALKGAYGVYTNTDSHTVSEQSEIWIGMRIFELAVFSGVKHFIYSSTPYTTKVIITLVSAVHLEGLRITAYRIRPGSSCSSPRC